LPDEPEFENSVMTAMDVEMVFSTGERVPFAYNFGYSGVATEIPDPTDVSYYGRLLALDLRFKAYCITNQGHILYPQYITSPHTPSGQTNIQLVVNGSTFIKTALKDGVVKPFIDEIQTKEDVPPESLILGPYQDVSFAQFIAVHPDLQNAALFMRTNYSFITKDIDYISTGGGLFGNYHSNLLESLELDNALISTYSSWAGVKNGV